MCAFLVTSAQCVTIAPEMMISEAVPPDCADKAKPFVPHRVSCPIPFSCGKRSSHTGEPLDKLKDSMVGSRFWLPGG